MGVQIALQGLWVAFIGFYLVFFVKSEIGIWIEGDFLGGDCNPLHIFICFIFDRIFLSELAESFWFVAFQEIRDILKCFCKPHAFSAPLLQSIKKQTILFCQLPSFFMSRKHYTQRWIQFNVYWWIYVTMKLDVKSFMCHAESAVSFSNVLGCS